MKVPLVLAQAALLAAAASVPAFAHHSVAAEFDPNQLLTVKGVITAVDWLNPHVHVYLDVTDGDGKVTKWSFESAPPLMLRRGGVTKEKMGIGQTVTVEGIRAKDAPNLGFLRKIIFADGHEIEMWTGEPPAK